MRGEGDQGCGIWKCLRRWERAWTSSPRFSCSRLLSSSILRKMLPHDFPLESWSAAIVFPSLPLYEDFKKTELSLSPCSQDEVEAGQSSRACSWRWSFALASIPSSFPGSWSGESTERTVVWDFSRGKMSFSCSLLMSQSTKISNSEFLRFDFRDSICNRFTCFSCVKQRAKTEWAHLGC